MRFVVSLVLIAGAMPLIATSLPTPLEFLSPFLWILSGIIFFIAAFMATKSKKNQYETHNQSK